MQTATKIKTKRILKRITRIAFAKKPQSGIVGRYELRFPPESPTLKYKSKFQLYDTQLAKIARCLQTRYPSLCAIDIGANVGDTAALIRTFSDIPVLCVEGDPTLLPILQENTTAMGSGISISPNFVGSEAASADPRLISEAGYNSSLISAISATPTNGAITLKSLESILQEHPQFSNAKLLKIDTEGCDFDILRQSLTFIRRAKPAIFFEYDPHFRPEEPKAGLDVLNLLEREGYRHFLYYDNFGNFLISATASHREILEDLHAYLGSNRRHGTAIYYFDLCAIHEEDTELVSQIRKESNGN